MRAFLALHLPIRDRPLFVCLVRLVGLNDRVASLLDLERLPPTPLAAFSSGGGGSIHGPSDPALVLAVSAASLCRADRVLGANLDRLLRLVTAASRVGLLLLCTPELLSLLPPTS